MSVGQVRQVAVSVYKSLDRRDGDKYKEKEEGGECEEGEKVGGDGRRRE